MSGRASTNVGLNSLLGVVLEGWDLLQGSSVHHNVDATEGLHEAVTIAHVAQEKTQIWVLTCREHGHHLRLFQLVAGEDDYLLGLVLREETLQERLAEGSRSPSDEDVGTIVDLFGLFEELGLIRGRDLGPKHLGSRKCRHRLRHSKCLSGRPKNNVVLLHAGGAIMRASTPIQAGPPLPGWG